MEADQDNTVAWAFDRLVDCPSVSTDTLMQTLLPSLFPMGLDELSETTRVRLLLRLLIEDLSAGQLDLEVLKALRRLAEVEGVGAWTAGGLSPRPPPELLLRAKTEVALAPLRAYQPELTMRNVLNEAFADPTPDEYRRWHEIDAAVGHPAAVAALCAAHSFRATLADLLQWALTLRGSLPPCILTAFDEDIAAGRYVVGKGSVQQRPAHGGLAAVPPPVPPPTFGSPARPPRGGVPARAAVVAEDAGMPMDEGYHSESPPRQQQQQQQAPRSTGRGRPATVVRQLDAAKAGLRQRGGADPLQQSLAAADGAAAAAAAAGVRPRGRTKQWEDEEGGSPFAKHPVPEMRMPDMARQPPLAQPSTGRRSAGRAAVQGEDEGEGDGRKKVKGQRRKRTLWTKEEEAALVRQIKRWGRGSWQAILDEMTQAGELRTERNPQDCKDKWRNLCKHGHVQPHEIVEIEEREKELRQELAAANKKRVGGRPPGWASPGVAHQPKRRRSRRGPGSDGEEEEEEEEEERDPVEEADEEDLDAQRQLESNDQHTGDEEEEDEGGEEVEEEDADDEQQQQQPERRQTRSQDAAAAAAAEARSPAKGRGGRGSGGRGRGRGRGRGGKK